MVPETARGRAPRHIGVGAVGVERRFGVSVDPWREVLPLIGSKEGIAHLPFAYLEPGDVAVIAADTVYHYGPGAAAYTLTVRPM